METTLDQVAETPPVPTIEWDESDIIDAEVERLAEELKSGEKTLEELGIRVRLSETDLEESDIEGLPDEAAQKKIWESLAEAERETKLRESVYGDSDLFRHEWESIKECLTEEIRSFNPDGCWHVTGQNMGWQHRSGYKTFRADDGEALLKAILPKTDCTWKITLEEGAWSMRNAHHDAPTGEFYTIYPFNPSRRADIYVQAALYDRLSEILADNEYEAADAEEAIATFKADMGDGYAARIEVISDEGRGVSVRGEFYCDGTRYECVGAASLDHEFYAREEFDGFTAEFFYRLVRQA